MEFEKVRQIISDQHDIPVETITADTSFVKDLSLDSLDIYQIISEIEDTFEIEFDTNDMETIKTVGDAVEYIKKVLP